MLDKKNAVQGEVISKLKSFRRCGVLMPIHSLTSDEGIGTIGKGAYRFIDFLVKSGHSVWQMLPLNVLSYGNSPYQSLSKNALNYYFIDLYALEKEGLLLKSEIKSADLFGENGRVDYGKQFMGKTRLLRLAFSRFNKED